MMVSKVRRRSGEFEAQLVTAEDPLASYATATIGLNSVNTGRSATSTAPPAPAWSWSSPPAPGSCGAPDPGHRCAASTALPGAAPHRRPARASPGYGPARCGRPPAPAATRPHQGSTQLYHRRHQWPGTPAAEPAARRRGTAPYRVRVTDLPRRGSRKTAAPVPAAAATWRSPARLPSPVPPRSPHGGWAGPQLPHEPGDMSPGRRQRVNPLTLARLQLLGKTTRIRVDRARRPPRSAQIPSHSAARSCRSRTGHLPDTAASIPRTTPVPADLR